MLRTGEIFKHNYVATIKDKRMERPVDVPIKTITFCAPSAKLEKETGSPQKINVELGNVSAAGKTVWRTEVVHQSILRTQLFNPCFFSGNPSVGNLLRYEFYAKVAVKNGHHTMTNRRQKK